MIWKIPDWFARTSHRESYANTNERISRPRQCASKFRWKNEPLFLFFCPVFIFRIFIFCITEKMSMRRWRRYLFKPSMPGFFPLFALPSCEMKRASCSFCLLENLGKKGLLLPSSFFCSYFTSGEKSSRMEKWHFWVSGVIARISRYQKSWSRPSDDDLVWKGRKKEKRWKERIKFNGRHFVREWNWDPFRSLDGASLRWPRTKLVH